MTAIDENTREQVDGLATRAKHLFRRSMRLAVVFGLLLFGTLGAFFLASHMEPSTALPSIDVPEKTFEVADLFDSHRGQHNSFPTSIFSLLMKISPAAGALAFVVGIAGLLCGRSGMSVLVMGGLLLLSVRLLNEFDFIPKNNIIIKNSFASERQHFVSEIKKDDFPSVRQQLKLRGRADEPAGLYLLAQMSIVEGENQMGITEDVIDRILSPAAGFAPNAKALYAIEHAAYGRPKSEVAVAYRDKLLFWQRWIQRMTMILGGTTIMAGSFWHGWHACVTPLLGVSGGLKAFVRWHETSASKYGRSIVRASDGVERGMKHLLIPGRYAGACRRQIGAATLYLGDVIECQPVTKLKRYKDNCG